MKHKFEYLRTEFSHDQLDQNQDRFVDFLDIYMPPKNQNQRMRFFWLEDRKTCVEIKDE